MNIKKTDLQALEPRPLLVDSGGTLLEQNTLSSIADSLSQRARYLADADSVNALLRFYTGQTREESRQIVNEMAIEWLTKYFTPSIPARAEKEVDKYFSDLDPEAMAYKAMCFAEVRGWWRVKWIERDDWLVGSQTDAFVLVLKHSSDMAQVRCDCLRLYIGYHRSWLYEDTSYARQLETSYSKLWHA